MDELPIKPRNRIILAIRVVISPLCSATFIPEEHHGHALAEKKRGQHIFNLSHANEVDTFVPGWAFDPIVVAVIVIFTIAIIFTIGLIMFVVITDQVVEGKSIM